MKPRPWSEATDAELGRVRAVALDIDDTLSTDGRLTGEAFAALWNLFNAGIVVVPVYNPHVVCCETPLRAGWEGQLHWSWSEHGQSPFCATSNARRGKPTSIAHARISRLAM